MLARIPKTRKFHYRPLFYREDQHLEEEEGKRIRFRRSPRIRKRQSSFIIMVILLILVIFLMEYLNRFRVETPKDVDIKNVEIVK